MKMILTAVALGAGIAGLILYSQKQREPQNRIKHAADDAYDTMNEAIGRIERPMQHAMG